MVGGNSDSRPLRFGDRSYKPSVHNCAKLTDAEYKRHIEGATRVKVRVTGDAVRVIPKTFALGVITDLKVFAVPK